MVKVGRLTSVTAGFVLRRIFVRSWVLPEPGAGKGTQVCAIRLFRHRAPIDSGTNCGRGGCNTLPEIGLQITHTIMIAAMASMRMIDVITFRLKFWPHMAA